MLEMEGVFEPSHYENAEAGVHKQTHLVQGHTSN
jgi:hypothetical protein